MADLHNIKKSGSNYSAVERIHSWIRNPEWQQGYSDILDPDYINKMMGGAYNTDVTNSSPNIKSILESAPHQSVMWSFIQSANDYHASRIHEKAEHLVSDIRDVDTCTIHALSSLATEIGASNVRGFDYAYPPELRELLDILSVNKSYLFMRGFLDEASRIEITTESEDNPHRLDTFKILPFNGTYRYTTSNDEVTNNWSLLDQTYMLANSDMSSYAGAIDIPEFAYMAQYVNVSNFREVASQWLVDNYQWDEMYRDAFLGLSEQGVDAPEYYAKYTFSDINFNKYCDTITKTLRNTIVRYLSADGFKHVYDIGLRYEKRVYTVAGCNDNAPVSVVSYINIPDRASIVSNKAKYSVPTHVNITAVTDAVLNGDVTLSELATNVKSVVELDIKERQNGIIWEHSEFRYDYEKNRVVRRWLDVIRYSSETGTPTDNCQSPDDDDFYSEFFACPMLPGGELSNVEVPCDYNDCAPVPVVNYNQLTDYNGDTVWRLNPEQDAIIDNCVQVFRNMVLYVNYHRQYLKQLVSKYKNTGSSRALISSIEEHLFRNFNPNSYWGYAGAHNSYGNLATTLTDNDDSTRPTIKIIEYYDDTEYFNIRASTDLPDFPVNARYWEDAAAAQSCDTDTLTECHMKESYRGISGDDFYSFYINSGFATTAPTEELNKKELVDMLDATFNAAATPDTAIATFYNIDTPLAASGSFGVFGKWTDAPLEVFLDEQPKYAWTKTPAFDVWMKSGAVSDLTEAQLLDLWIQETDLVQWQTDFTVIPGVLEKPPVKTWIEQTYSLYDYVQNAATSVWLQSSLGIGMGINSVKARWKTTVEDPVYNGDVDRVIEEGWRDVKWVNDPALAKTTGWRDLEAVRTWVKSGPIKVAKDSPRELQEAFRYVSGGPEDRIPDGTVIPSGDVAFTATVPTDKVSFITLKSEILADVTVSLPQASTVPAGYMIVLADKYGSVSNTNQLKASAFAGDTIKEVSIPDDINDYDEDGNKTETMDFDGNIKVPYGNRGFISDGKKTWKVDPYPPGWKTAALSMDTLPPLPGKVTTRTKYNETIWEISQDEWDNSPFVKMFTAAPFDRKKIGTTFNPRVHWQLSPFVDYFIDAPFVLTLTNPEVFVTETDIAAEYGFALPLTKADKQTYLANIKAIPYADGGLHRYSEDYDGSMWDIYRRYIASADGELPVYNYKNTIHPTIAPTTYMYGIVNADNSMSSGCILTPRLPKLERQTVESLAARIGQLGNTIRAWFDFNKFQGYITNYEYATNATYTGELNRNFDYDGPWIPDALRDFLHDPTVFIDSITDGSNKYVNVLELNDIELAGIAVKIQAYTADIIALKDQVIYQHAVDKYGNTYILYKTDRNFETPGRMWVRYKNHPLALPMLHDVNTTSELSQMTISVTDGDDTPAPRLRYGANHCYTFDINASEFLTLYGAQERTTSCDNPLESYDCEGQYPFIHGFCNIVQIGYIRDLATDVAILTIVPPPNTGFSGFELTQADKFIGIGYVGKTIVMAKVKKDPALVQVDLEFDGHYLVTGDCNDDECCSYKATVVFDMYVTDEKYAYTETKTTVVKYREYVVMDGVNAVPTSNWKLSVSDSLISCVFESEPPLDTNGGFFVHQSTVGTQHNVSYFDPTCNNSDGMYANGFTTLDFGITLYNDRVLFFRDKPPAVDYFYNFTRVGYIGLSGCASPLF